jgi:hypothetical protein
MNYLCQECDKEFATKQGLQYHLSKKVCHKTKGIICNYCDKEFTARSSLSRHKKSFCKQITDEDIQEIIDDVNEISIKSKSNEDMVKIYQMMIRLREENKMLKYDNDTLQKKVSKNEKTLITSDITNNINNGVINNVNQYILVGYGKEDMDRIDRSDLLKVLRTGFNSPLSLTETMHFNPKYPEFHNVYIPSMKDKYAMIYDGSEWTMVTKEYLIDKMYDDKRVYIEENLDDFLDSLTNSQQKALQRWMKAEENHPYIAKIKDDIKLLLYNKRKIPVDNKKTIIDVSYDIDDDNIVIDDTESNTHNAYVIPKYNNHEDKKSMINSVIVPRKRTKCKVIRRK